MSLCSSVLRSGETEDAGGMISGRCESGAKPGWGGVLLPHLHFWGRGWGTKNLVVRWLKPGLGRKLLSSK